MGTDALTGALRETIALFDPTGEPRTTTEVADDLDLGRRSTYNRLERLVEHDRLDTKKVGANGRVWWQPPAAAPTTPDWPAAAESLVDDVLDDVEVGIFVLDENFNVAWVNEATERYFGLNSAHAIGRDKRRLIDDHLQSVVDDSERFAETVLATYDDNTCTEQFECHVTAGEDREDRWLEHRSKPVESGTYAGGRVELYYDVTAQRETGRERQETERQFRTLVDAVEEYAIFMLGPDGHVQTWNEGARQIKGYEDDEIVGEHFSTFYIPEDRETDTPERNLAAAAEYGSFTDEGWRIREDGSRFYASVTITAIRDDVGDVEGYVKVTRDMTDRRRARKEHQLQLSVSRSIAEATSLEMGLQAAMEHVCEWTDWEVGQAWTPTEGGTVERLSSSFAESEVFARFNEASADFTFDLGEGIPGKALQTKRPVWFPNVSADEYHRAELVAEAGVKAGLGVPVVVDDEVAVILEFYMSEARHRDDWVVQIVTSIAAELAGLVARKEAEDGLERQRYLTKNVLETVPVGVGVLSSDGELVRVNERATEILGIDGEGPNPDDYAAGERRIYDTEGKPVPPEERPYSRVFETGDPVLDWQCQIEYPDGERRWLSINVAPLADEDGEVKQVVTAGEDITQLKEQARRLERHRDELQHELDDIFERVSDGFFGLDTELRFTYVNERATDLLGQAEQGLLGTPIWEAFEPGPKAQVVFEEVLETQEPTTFEEYYEPLDTWFENHVYPSETGLSVYFQDVTERKERERELEMYETIVETVHDGVYALDDEDRFVFVNEAFSNLTGYGREELLGEHPTLINSQAVNDRANELERAVDTGERDSATLEFDLQTAAGDLVPVEGHFDPFQFGEMSGRCGVVRDVTDRVERERDLQRYETIVETVDDGIYVVDEDYRFQLVNGAHEEFVGRSREELLGSHISTIVDEDTVELGDRLRKELQGSDADSGSVELDMENADGETRTVEINFSVLRGDGEVQGTTGIIRDITERLERERELDRQREQLSVLNSLNEVVRDITGAVIDQSTREEIEATVCERLAESDSYEFAWIAEVDPQTMELDPHVEAGVDGYLETVPTSMNPDDPSGHGPGAKALRTREIQTTQDALTDPDFEPWREHAKQYGYRSAAGIPIVHDGTLYGLLGVYADRPKAFESQEQEVIGQLGEVVGHAIAAAERKRALLSDELVELDVRIQDVFAAVEAPTETEGTITLDHMVPVDDEVFLVYGTATPDALDSVHGLVDVLPHWESVTVVSEEEPVRFKLRVIDPPVLSIVASRGGYIDEAVIEDGNYRTTIHLAPSVDVRQVTDAVEAAYPQAELLRRHQISRSHDELHQLRRRLATDFTDRQRTALEAAYHAGFFEWPRETTGEQVAESLDIAPPTFHHHLRKAQQKAFDALLSAPHP